MWQSTKQLIKLLYANLYLLCYPKARDLQRTDPIFVVGCGHSGTSLMLRMLDAHSNLLAIPEETGILQAERNRKVILWKFHRTCKRIKLTTHQRFLEKTPRHIYAIQKIFEVFPNAQIILMLRDGRDVACSIKNRYGDFEKGVDRWITDNEIARIFWNHPKVYVQKLEDLQQQPAESLKKITSFLAEPFELEMLNYYQEKKNYYADALQYSSGTKGEEDHKVRRNWQINQPLIKSTSRWEKEMTPSEKALFKKKAQYLLEEFGYAEKEDW